MTKKTLYGNLVHARGYSEIIVEVEEETFTLTAYNFDKVPEGSELRLSLTNPDGTERKIEFVLIDDPETREAN